MAQKDLLRRLDLMMDGGSGTIGKKKALKANKGLPKDLKLSVSTDKFRRNMNEPLTHCEVRKKILGDSLKQAYDRYNPSASAEMKKEAADLIDSFCKDVIAGWTRTVSNPSKKIETGDKKSTLDNVYFDIVGGDAEKHFQDLNKKVCEPLMLGRYKDLFSASSQEKEYDGKRKDGLGSLSDLQAAHSEGQSVFSVKESVRADALSGMDVDGLESEQASIVKKALKDFEQVMGGKANSSFTFDSKTGKIKSTTTITLGIESATKNRGDIGNTDSLGRKQNAVLNSMAKKIRESLQNADGSEMVNLSSSNTLPEGMGEAIVNSLVMKKMYKSKKALNRTKYGKVKVKSSTTNASSTKTIGKRKEFTIIGGGPTSNMKGPPPKRTSPESGGGKSPEELGRTAKSALLIRQAINKVLPKRVKRNMTGSALKNKSGRFAESARIEQVSSAAKTLVIKFTYRLNPYETFENTGKRKWPTGYNPKTLIAKSIRQLALELMGIKMITTRRV